VSDIVIDTSQAATDTIDYVATDTWGNSLTYPRTSNDMPSVRAFTNVEIALRLSDFAIFFTPTFFLARPFSL
jgi:hypothetical protein